MNTGSAEQQHPDTGARRLMCILIYRTYVLARLRCHIVLRYPSIYRVYITKRNNIGLRALTKDIVIWPEQLSSGPRPHGVHCARLQVNESCSRDVLSTCVATVKKKKEETRLNTWGAFTWDRLVYSTGIDDERALLEKSPCWGMNGIVFFSIPIAFFPFRWQDLQNGWNGCLGIMLYCKMDGMVVWVLCYIAEWMEWVFGYYVILQNGWNGCLGIMLYCRMDGMGVWVLCYIAEWMEWVFGYYVILQNGWNGCLGIMLFLLRNRNSRSITK